MPRTVTVTLDDGQSVVYQNVPEATTPEEVTARATQEHGRGVTSIDGGAKPDHYANIAREAKLVGSAALQGVAGLPALAMDAGKWLVSRGQAGSFGRHTAGVQGGAEELFGVKPETPKEKLLQAVVSGAAGGFLPGGPIRGMVAGASAGLGGEIAGRMSNDNPIAKIAGALAGGTAGGVSAALVGAARPQTVDVARKALAGIAPADLAKAKVFQAQAAGQGAPVDLVQALEGVGVQPGTLQSLRDVLANNQSGEKLQAMLRAQPHELSMQADMAVGRLPGTVYQPEVVANTVQELSTGIVNSAKQARSGEVRKLYEAVGALPESAQQNILTLVEMAAAKPGATDGLKSVAAELRQKFSGRAPDTQVRIESAREAITNAMSPSGKLAARKELADANAAGTVVKPLHALDADTALSDAVGPYRGTPLSPVDPKTSGQVKRLAGDINQELQSGVPALATAEGRYRQISQDVVEPLKQGPVGQLATKAGYKPDTQASVAKLDAIFSKGSNPDSGGPSQILALAKELNQVEPTAFADAAKTWLSGRMSKIMAASAEGTTTDDQLAKNLQSALFAKRQQFQGLRDLTAGIADGYGLPRQDVVRGLENLAQLTKAMANRPGSVGGASREELEKMAGSSSIANSARIFGFLPFERAARKIEEFKMGATFREFDKLLTTPEGAQTLAELGRVSALSPKMASILATFNAAVQAGKTPGSTP